MKIIELTQGQVTQVDDWWYEYLIQWKWCALWNPHTKSYYAARNSSRKIGKHRTIRMHREIAGAADRIPVDHKNGNTLCNLEENLRVCTTLENMRNYKKPCTNTSGYKGVCKDGNWYRARIIVNKKRVSLGYFPDPVDAARAYDKAAKEYYGEFALLNFSVEESC